MKNKYVRGLGFCFIGILFASVVRAEELNVYFVGNSLTDRMKPQKGLRGLAEERLHTLSGQLGQSDFSQFVPGASLSYHWYQGPNYQDPPYHYYIDDFGPALRDNFWDVLVLQAYNGKLWDWETSPFQDPKFRFWQDRPREQGNVPICNNFIDLPVNQGISGNGMKVYLYSIWPKVPGAPDDPDYEAFDFKVEWDAQFNPEEGGQRVRGYWPALHQELNDDFWSQLANEIMLIPVGDALYELNERLRANPLTGADEIVYSDVEQVYGDGNHLSPGVTQYLKALVFFSTLYREDPHGLSLGRYNDTNLYYAGTQWMFVEITPEWKTLLQDVAWDVAATHFLAGLRDSLKFGDADLDGDADADDLDILTVAMGRTDVDEHATGIGWLNGDFDGDGSVNQTDMNIYLANADPEVDSDRDDLPNWWEELHYGGATNANPTAMSSNGVNTVRQAYIAGLDPTNPSSLFLISDLSPLTSSPVLRWSAASGRVYSVWWSSNLLSNFQPLESDLPWTNMPYTDTHHPGDEKGFYKIEVELE